MELEDYSQPIPPGEEEDAQKCGRVQAGDAIKIIFYFGFDSNLLIPCPCLFVLSCLRLAAWVEL